MIHARKDYDHIQDPSGKIPDDEPVFLLRAQDGNAPDVVDYWATVAGFHGANQDIVQAARDHAQRMRDWQETHGFKTPDMPSGVAR